MRTTRDERRALTPETVISSEASTGVEQVRPMRVDSSPPTPEESRRNGGRGLNGRDPYPSDANSQDDDTHEDGWAEPTPREIRQRERMELLQELGDVSRRLNELEILDQSESTSGNEHRRTVILDGPLEAGHYVKIIAKDKYRGRTGRLMSRRGVKFWNILLDSLEGPGERIYKTDAMLERLPFRTQED